MTSDLPSSPSDKSGTETEATGPVLREIVQAILQSEIPGHETGQVLNVGQKPAGNGKGQAGPIPQTVAARLSECNPKQIRESLIPEIIEELLKVVAILEDSAHGLINGIEEIERLCTLVDPSLQPELQMNLTQMLEHITFQDISSQRMNTVIRKLARIETITDGLLGSTGDEKAEKRWAEKKELILGAGAVLEGPQDTDDQTQARIDALFSSP